MAFTLAYEWIDDPSLSWSDGLIESWSDGVTPTLRQLWYDEDYLYVTTVSGLTIHDIDTGIKLSYITYEKGFTAIWGSDTTLYLGTVYSGIQYINKEDITFEVNIFKDVSCNLKKYDYYYNTSHPTIRFLDGYRDELVIVTESGIDIVNNTNNGFKSHYSDSTITKCYITSKRETYYTSRSTIDNLYNTKYSLCDWTIPDKIYSCDGTFFPAETKINDVYITERTSISGIANTLFVATNSGVYVIDEETNIYDHYTDLIPDMSNNIVSMHASRDASRTKGKLHITSTGKGASVVIVNLNDKTIYDRYTGTQKGRANVTLIRSDIVDSL